MHALRGIKIGQMAKRSLRGSDGWSALFVSIRKNSELLLGASFLPFVCAVF